MSTKARALKAEGRNIIDLSAGRARPADAREHQGSRGQGAAREQDQVHRRRRHSRAEGRRRRQVQARERARLQAEPGVGRHRRQAGAVQRAHLHAQPGRRGGDPGALLGVLCRHRAARRRQAGAGQLPVRGRLSPASRGSRRGHHTQNQVVRVQRALQPVGCRLHEGAAEGADRCADDAQEQACLGADGRYVRAPDLRRHRVLHAGPGRAQASTSARSP